MSLRILLPLGLLAALLSSCTQTSGISSPNRPYLAGLGVTARTGFSNPAEASSFWDGDSVTGAPSIRINRADQKAYFYKGGELVGVSPISTGSKKHITPAGRFRVTQRSKDHESSLYGVIKDAATGQVINDDADTRLHKAGPGEVFVHAPMPYFLRFNGGIGMHAGFLPGFPASHGCVRMPEQMAQKFFEHAPLNTPVIVE
jgi:hypothetical protein